jgi:hypothetical protein
MSFLDNPGPWRVREVDNTFTWTMHDQARHGAAYLRIYVTRQGFDPLTERLAWSDLELVLDTGSFRDQGWPTRPNDPILNGVDYGPFQISAPGRTGRHIVYAAWRAGHADQNYYMCSDVRFPGGEPDPTPSPPPPLPADDGCSATYTRISQWNGGFQDSMDAQMAADLVAMARPVTKWATRVETAHGMAGRRAPGPRRRRAEVTVTAGATAIRGWTLAMRFPDAQIIDQAWGASVSSDGVTVTARDVGFNGSLAPGAGTTFGFLGKWLGANGNPAISCAATR